MEDLTLYRTLLVVEEVTPEDNKDVSRKDVVSHKDAVSHNDANLRKEVSF